SFRREEKAMVRNKLPPASAEQAEPGGGDVRGFDHEPAARPQDAIEFIQRAARAGQMLDDVIKRRDVEMLAGKMRIEECPADAFQSARARYAAARRICFH